jgi:Tol biopolymer transport system component
MQRFVHQGITGRLTATLLLAVTAAPVVARAADPAPAPAAPAPAAPAATLSAFGRWVIAADFTRDGATLVTAGGESLLYRPGDVVVWKADGSRVGDLAGHPTAVWAVKVSKDGKLAATAGYDGLVKLWDLPARTLKHDLKKHKGWVRSLDFSPDGTKLASAGEDGTVVLWNTADGKEIKAVTAHAGPVTAVAFSPDGGTLATGGGDKLVKLWNAADGAEKGKLEGHADALWAVGYSPDGSKLATAGADRTIRLWTTSDSKEFATLSGHKDWVTSVGFSPDGTRLVTGSLDGAVKLWDVNAKGEQEGPEAAKSSVWCTTFSPDGKTIFVGTHVGGKLVPTPAAKLLPPPPPPPAPPTPPPAPAATAQKWTPLVPTEFKSMAGATGAIAADGTIMVTGTLAKDTYTIKAALPAGTDVKGFKLETLADPTLPLQGPGRAGNGNFVVSTVAVLFGPPESKDTPTSVKFAAAKADYEQGGFPAANTIDGKSDTGWAISNGTGKDHALTLDVAPDVKLPGGAPVLITIDQQYDDGQHNLGKFRLSVMQDAAPAAAPAAK